MMLCLHWYDFCVTWMQITSIVFFACLCLTKIASIFVCLITYLYTLIHKFRINGHSFLLLLLTSSNLSMCERVSYRPLDIPFFFWSSWKWYLVSLISGVGNLSGRGLPDRLFSRLTLWNIWIALTFMNLPCGLNLCKFCEIMTSWSFEFYKNFSYRKFTHKLPLFREWFVSEKFCGHKY